MTDKVWLKLSEVVTLFRDHGLPHDRRTIVGMIQSGELIGQKFRFFWRVDKESVERVIEG